MEEQVGAARRRRRRRRERRPRRSSPSSSGGSLPVYRGPFGLAQAERLLWRAGFGPRPGEAARLARNGLADAVRSLTRPPREHLSGPSPTDGDGHPLAPTDAYGHEQLWWLDKMVRSRRPLVERMTLVWHDWFATSNDEVGSTRLMIGQNNLFRRYALGSFEKLLVAVTRDPAMLLWLSGADSTKEAPNENYARELMELFTIGVGRGYSEGDVREQARALTGFTNDWDENLGPVRFRLEPELHDGDAKRVFGKRGHFDWRDSCRLCLEHRSHPSFFVQKLWSYFVPTPPPTRTRQALQRLYVGRDYAVRPVVEAILRHPALYEGPRMVKPPAVFIAGMLRALERGIDTDSWVWLSDLGGQQLFYPPDVAGWDDTRWLDTSTWRGRWLAVIEAVKDRLLDPDEHKDPAYAEENPAEAVDRALRFWGSPSISPDTRGALEQFAARCRAGANREWKRDTYALLCQNALRMMIATSPDLHTC